MASTVQAPSVNAVRTTGIYCQASCPAKPNPENTSRYSSAVAAEAAGYRACLRCRPYRRAGTWVDPAGSQPVEAALALITDGYLDYRTEAELAAEVGYSARQLRRLFDLHIGATPDYLARSRRARFARQLIDDTDLNFINIATAAGFGSQRQFYRVITDVFGFTPTQLRAKRRKGEQLPAEPSEGLRLLVPYVSPYNFAQVLGHLRPRATAGVEVVTADTYRRSINVCGEPGVIEVTDAKDGQHLALTLHLSSYNCVIDDVQRCRTLFATDEDPRQAARLLKSAQHLAPLVRKQPGLRVPRNWDRFETVVRIIVGQQISVAGASTITGRIAAAVGDSFDSGFEGITHVFPDAAEVARSSLTGLGLTKRRISTLLAVADAIATGELDLLSVASLEEVTEQWCAMPGIGPWTAQLISMRALRRDDAWPPGDLGLLKGLEELGLVSGATGSVKARTNNEASVTAAWRPYRSWAAQYIWSAASRPKPKIAKNQSPRTSNQTIQTTRSKS